MQSQRYAVAITNFLYFLLAQNPTNLYPEQMLYQIQDENQDAIWDHVFSSDVFYFSFPL